MRKTCHIAMSLIGATLLFASPGCWMMADWGDHGHGTDSDTDTDTDSETDSDSDTECHEVEIPAHDDPARVLILLDHSSSMVGENWNIARAAVQNLLETFSSGSIEFGLDTLPDPDFGDCSVSAPIAVDCGPGTQPAIDNALSDMATFVSTPLYYAMENFTDPGYAPGCTSAEHDRYILLIADGEDSCAYAPTEQFIELTDALVDLGIRVIVVGFNVNIDSGQLEAIASHGGTEFTSYLNASDEPSLNAALDTIADSIDSCFFTIDWPEASAHPDLVNFYFDGVVVPMDEDCSSGFGWRWTDEEHVQVEFCETSCELLEGGLVDDLRATFGCETVIGS